MAMNDYLVTWSIDVDSAYTAVEAAKEAAACQADQTVGGMGKSTGVFVVTNKATGETVLVDLNEEESLNNEMDLKSANANLELDIEDLKFENRGLMETNRRLMKEMAALEGKK